MDRLIVLAPALILLALMLLGFAVYCILHAIGRPPTVTGLKRRRFTDLIGPLVTGYTLWVLQPVERALVAMRVSPNFLTMLSLGACAGAGLTIATNHMATAAWLYALAGLLDILDGRLARATNRCSKAGAFLDSVLDRWGELLVFSGFAWFLRDSYWLLAVMAATAGSVMVSYTRARGEALGVDLDGGTMQRAERIALVSIGTLVTAWFAEGKETAEYSFDVIGVALLIVGVGAAATAIGRLIRGYLLLREKEQDSVGRDQIETKSNAKAR